MKRFLLSLFLVVSFALAQPPGQGVAPTIMNSPEVLNYTLTMDKVDKWAAANRALIPYVKAHPDALKKAQPNPSEIKNLDDIVKYMKAQAADYVRPIESAGLSFKEYLILSFAISTAFAAESMSERGMQAPPGMPTPNPANVAFVKANKAKFMQMFTEYQQMK